MNTARFVLKIVAAALAVAALACSLVAFWDKIVDIFYAISDKLEEKKADLCIGSEYEDYDDSALTQN